MIDETEALDSATPEQDAESAEVESNSRSENEILADIVKSSKFTEDDESLPEEIFEQDDADEEDSIDPEEDSESENVDEEDIESEEENEDDEDASEEDATDEVEIISEDEVDWEVQIPVNIDGEVQNISLAELRKGYATDQHLSKKGREIGELRKEIDAEREQKLAEVNNLTAAISSIFQSTEEQLAREYHELDNRINEARENGDTFELSELKDKREVAQAKYWEARQQRESIVNSATVEQQKLVEEKWNTQVTNFFEKIPEYIPEYNDEYANKLVEFGRNKGLSDEYMAAITDPVIVKILDDYRKLEQGVTTGAKKREKIKVRKAPIKKSKPVEQKKIDQERMVKARAFKQDASRDEQMAFLRNYAQKSLSQQ